MIHCVCHKFGDRGAPTLQGSAMSIEKRMSKLWHSSGVLCIM